MRISIEVNLPYLVNRSPLYAML